MVGKTKQRERNRWSIGDREESAAAETRPSITEALFYAGRAVYGAVLGFMAFDNARNMDGRIEYAESKGAPMADVTVPLMTALLLVEGVATALGRVPKLAAGFVASFFVSVTPVMHDFWNVDDPQEKQQQQIHFLKNVALLGTAIALVGEEEKSE